MPTLADLTGDFSDILIRDVGNTARPLETDGDLTPILNQIGNARYVLLGEASHGTHEYYTWRHRLTARLIREKGFQFVAVEGDWPDCYEVNRYIKNYAETPKDAIASLKSFLRWPTWMWANREIVHLVQWLREYNDAFSKTEPTAPKIGFYGLDVYSLRESMEAVIGFLDRVDPQAAQNAREAYGCFEPYSDDGQEYAWAATFVPSSCEEAAIATLTELRRNAKQYGGGDGIEARENGFAAEQNAFVVRDAEAYYRTMVRPGPDSWNVRDHHMVETLERLMAFHGPDAKAIVWEHNTHVGDARATDMACDGMVNVGQLVREAHEAEGVYIVGFGSHRGSVIAGEAWEAPMQIMEVPPARQGSW